VSPEDKKSDFGSIASLLKKTAEDSRRGGPPAGTAPGSSPADLSPEPMLYALPTTLTEVDTFTALPGEGLPDEPIIALPEAVSDPRRERILHAAKIGGVALLIGLMLALALWLVLKQPSLEKRYAHGAQLIRDRQDAAALKLFAECQAEDTLDARLHVAYAQAYWERGDADQAVAVARDGLRISGSQRELLTLLGRIGLARNDLALAEEGAQELIRAYHQELDGYLLQAEIELARKRNDEAIAVLRQAEWFSEKDPAVYRLLRRAWLRAGDIERARAANEELVRQRAAAETEEDYLDLIGLQLALDNTYLAAEYTRNGRERYPDSERLLKCEVAVAIRGQRLDRAQAGAQELLAKLPADPAGYYFLGEVAYVRGDLGAALGRLQEATRVDPRYAPALARLGDIALLHLRDVPAALVQYRQAEEAGAADGAFWGNYALALFRAGQHAEAAVRWEKAARLLPRSLQVAYNLATAYLLTDRGDSAAALYQRCIALEAVQGRVQNNLGVIAELAGDTRTAARQYLAAREIAAERGWPQSVAAANLERFFRGTPLLSVAMAADPTVLAEEPTQ